MTLHPIGSGVSTTLVVRCVRALNFFRGVICLKKTYKIDVDCANCANLMETEAKKTSGVKDAVVNFMTLKMKVEFDDGVEPREVMERVRENCKHVEKDCEIFL